MLTKAAQYTIRSTIYLAVNSSEEKRINVKQISKDINAPAFFLSKLLQQLSKAGLVSSTKGPHGGFYLSKLNKKNTLWDVIKCIDGGQKFNDCFMGRPVCDMDNPCVFHEVAIEFRNTMMKKLKEKPIELIIDEPDVVFY